MHDKIKSVQAQLHTEFVKKIVYARIMHDDINNDDDII